MVTSTKERVCDWALKDEQGLTGEQKERRRVLGCTMGAGYSRTGRQCWARYHRQWNAAHKADFIW